MDVDEVEEHTVASHKKDEQLDCDLSAYVLFHEGNTGAPCLSFDVVRDDLGNNRDCENPTTCYFISGSQASQSHLNNVVLIKMSNLKKVKEEDNDSEAEEADDDEEDLPEITAALASHNGCVNRIRATVVDGTPIAASWSEFGQVSIWDLSSMVEAVNNSESMKNYQRSQHSPLFTYNGHGVEGFAIDWSPVLHGTLASGDCSKNIYIYKPQEGGSWNVNSKPFAAHTNSVEDIQWSPNEANVFASCSVDKSIRIWDARAEPHRACMLTCENAHDQDVNVIHWNRNEPFIASGGDDAKVLVWDLRKFETKTPVAHLQYHHSPVCTIEWHPSDASVLATGGEDDQILQWDLAVEKEDSNENSAGEDIPQQLLFIHQGQKEVKEIHWHPQIPGLLLSTAHSGFNIFKTISC